MDFQERINCKFPLAQADLVRQLEYTKLL
jgi:hypothetical protein